MKKSILLYVLCLIISIVSCTDQTKNKLNFASELDLKGISWNIDSSLGKAYNICVVNDYLIVRNDNDSTKLTAIDLNDKKNIANFGKGGDGPNELINPGSIFPLKSSVAVFDGGRMELVRYKLQEGVDKGLSLETVFRTEVNGIVSMVGLSDSCFVASGIFQNNRLCLLNKAGKVETWSGRYPVESSTENIPFHVLGMACQSVMCAQPNGNKIGLATRYGGIVQVYELDKKNRTLSEIHCINTFSPDLTTRDVNGTPNFRPTKDTKWGYLSMVATEKFIFSLYSGRYQREGAIFYAGNHIHVFDWDGKPLFDLQLNRDGTCIAVTKHSILLLTETVEKGYDIVEYKLPKELI